MAADSSEPTEQNRTGDCGISLMHPEEISHLTVILNPTNVYTEQEAQEILCQCLSFFFLEIFYFVFNCPTQQ